MSGLTKEQFEDWMWRLRYVEVVIGYKGQRYHIEGYNKKYGKHLKGLIKNEWIS